MKNIVKVLEELLAGCRKIYIVVAGVPVVVKVWRL